jgi:hypothetical protein
VRRKVVVNEGRKLWMDRVNGKVSKVRVQGVNEWLACKYMKLAP